MLTVLHKESKSFNAILVNEQSLDEVIEKLNINANDWVRSHFIKKEAIFLDGNITNNISTIVNFGNYIVFDEHGLRGIYSEADLMNNFMVLDDPQRDLIKDLALTHGFKLKQQPSGEMDLNPYVYQFAAALLALKLK